MFCPSALNFNSRNYNLSKLSPSSTTRICSGHAKRRPKSGIVIGQRKQPLQKAHSPANHVAEFVVRTKNSPSEKRALEYTILYCVDAIVPQIWTSCTRSSHCSYLMSFARKISLCKYLYGKEAELVRRCVHHRIIETGMVPRYKRKLTPR